MTDSARQRDPARQRERRLADVFGDILPETTSDERADRRAEGSAEERWYRENRPPHHDS